VATVTTAQTADRDDSRPASAAAGNPYRQRLLDALAQSIAGDGYRATTVADIVRRARTSRRTFYEHFADKEACFIALLTEANADVIRRIYAAVDPQAPPETQIQQAITAWIESADSQPALMLSWIRDSPTLGAKTRRLQRDLQEGFVELLQNLTDTAELRAAGIGPVSRQMAIVLLGGLRELIAVTVEDGGPMRDIRDAALQASLALLGDHREPVSGRETLSGRESLSGRETLSGGETLPGPGERG
jgi:AcrR family transcriptional regulator